MDTPQLKLAEFLPDRLAMLAETVNQPFLQSCIERHGLTLSEWRVLASLGESGQLTSVAISRSIRMHKVKISRAIAGLENKGLIGRVANREDMREAFVALTDKGQDVYREIAAQALAFSTRISAGLSKSDKAALWRIMAALEDSAGRDNG